MNPNRPRLRHIANLWTLVGHPSQQSEWSLERKIRAVKAAGFDGFTTRLTPEHKHWADKLGLIGVGFVAASNAAKFAGLLREQKAAGAYHVNVHLAAHDTPPAVALGLAKKLMRAAQKLGVEAAIEVHRNTCTETPEKTYALADGYQKATGQLLPLTWDYSHLAIVKHLQPPYWLRLGGRPDLIQRAQQFHFRPFNGHHCQVPVTDGRGHLTPEVLDYLPFAEKVMATWLAAAPPGRELFAVPEMGPLWLGYNLHGLPGSWAEAKTLRGELEKCWQRAVRKWPPPKSGFPLTRGLRLSRLRFSSVKPNPSHTL